MISDKVLAMCELMNDLLYQKIPESRHGYYVNQSLSIGYQTAEIIKAEFGENRAPDMEDLYRKFQIKIEFLEKSSKNCGVSFRAQSEYGKDGSAKILIYMESIEMLASKSQYDLPGETYEGMSRKQALNIHLAHEFFHFLEYKSSVKQGGHMTDIYDKGYVSDYLEPVPLISFMGWKRKGSILRCSEIAAHAFAKELLGLPVLPNFFDYAYLMNEKRLRPEDFQRMVEENGRAFCS